jgi:trigger factor
MDEDEVDKAVRDTVRRLSGQLRVPGFRPGKVPRQVLEARLGGSAVLREQAIRDALPDIYAQAVVDTEVDPIAPPDIDITGGAENGAVSFDAVVEVRPSVTIPGYAGLVVTLPSLEVTDEDVDVQINRLRDQFGELTTVGRPAKDGDYATIDLRGQRVGDEDVNVEDYLYEIGSGSDVEGLDDQLRGAKAGDIFEFTAKLPNSSGEATDASIKVLVKEVKEKVLPEATDEWASEASEFDTLDALKDELRSQVSRVRTSQARLLFRERALEALEGLVEEDPPEALIDSEIQERLHDLAHRLEDRKMSLEQFLRATGQDPQILRDGLRMGAIRTVKADLALRALADAEDLQISDEELDKYFSDMAEQTGMKPRQVRERIEQGGRLAAIRSEQRKAKAMNWLLEHVELVDEEGNSIDRSVLEPVSGPEGDGPPIAAAENEDEVDSVDKEDADMGTAR